LSTAEEELMPAKEEEELHTAVLTAVLTAVWTAGG
jgi:hypothetical protein